MRGTVDEKIYRDGSRILYIIHCSAIEEYFYLTQRKVVLLLPCPFASIYICRYKYATILREPRSCDELLRMQFFLHPEITIS